MRKLSILATALLLFAPPLSAGAVVQSLNGQTGNTQAFANDTNITISSASNVHTLGWSGILQPNRGGTGTSTTMTQGSILFAGASGVYSQDNSNLFWDNTNHVLKVGTASTTIESGGQLFIRAVNTTPGESESVYIFGADKVNDRGGSVNLTGGQSDHNGGGNINIFGGPSGVDSNNQAGGVLISSGDVRGSGTSSGITLVAQNSKFGGAGISITTTNVPTGSFGQSGNITINVGNSSSSSQGGSLQMRAGNAGPLGGEGGSVVIQSGYGLASGYSGGNIILALGAGGSSGQGGFLMVYPDNDFNKRVTLNFNSAAGSSYTFPQATGTFPLLQSNQTFTGLNKFQASSNSTIYVGSSSLTGCIAMGDSDGSGVTYITANDGVLIASSTKPSICQ